MQHGVGGTKGRAVAISCPQVILQTFHIFRVADLQQLSPLLGAEEGLQNRCVGVKSSGALQGSGQHRGEDRSWHLGWSWSRLRLWGCSPGHEGEELVGVDVGIAQHDSSRLNVHRHHHCSLWLAGGLWNTLWIIRISTGLVDFTEVLEIVIEGGPLL